MLSSSETESTCPSPCQSSNTTSSETIAIVSSDYVEPPSKSTTVTASNNLSSEDDAIEIETSEIVSKKNKFDNRTFDLAKYTDTFNLLQTRK